MTNYSVRSATLEILREPEDVVIAVASSLDQAYHIVYVLNFAEQYHRSFSGKLLCTTCSRMTPTASLGMGFWTCDQCAERFEFNPSCA